MRSVLIGTVSAAFVAAGSASHAASPSLTIGEALGLLHGPMAITAGGLPADAMIGAGYVPGVAGKGIPSLRETDASLGVAYVMGLRHDGATALPSGLAAAASFSPDLAYQGGAMIGREARAKGFDVLLAGGVDLARDPRGGRNFEYVGEDPLLAGRMAGAAIAGIQDQHIVSTIKHFALNDLETGRTVHTAVIAEPAARESDLLAFEIAIERGRPGSVMCAYNRVNGPYACENPWLLNEVLKGDWHYPGWVMSDWGAVHGTGALMAGLDQESGEQLDDKIWFGAPLAARAAADPGVQARVMEAAHRIAATLARVGVGSQTPGMQPIDFAGDAVVSQRVAEAGIVMLRNQGDLLPLSPNTVRSIAVIGGHADFGVLSGGGSSQVAGPGGPGLAIKLGGTGTLDGLFHTEMYTGPSPLAAIRQMAPLAKIRFALSRYPAAAAEAARGADVAIVFATQWCSEGEDLPDLSLPDGQDAVIEAVAKSNPHTIVVLETGNPVLMPWQDSVSGIVEAWYSGSNGGQAIANILFGKTPPAGRLPISFPAALAQLPRPALPESRLAELGNFKVVYTEGSDVGYRWHAARRQVPLYAFGYGLSTTRFSLSALHILHGETPRFNVTVTNTGGRAGIDTPQLYLTGAPNRTQQRLLGWSRVALNPGESRMVTIETDGRLFADWDEAGHRWTIAGGAYQIAVGESATDLKLRDSVSLAARTLPP